MSPLILATISLGVPLERMQRVPARSVDEADAELVEGRNVRKLRRSRAAGHCQGAHLAGADVADGATERGVIQSEMRPEIMSVTAWLNDVYGTCWTLMPARSLNSVVAR